jgi:hypothetical protein
VETADLSLFEAIRKGLRLLRAAVFLRNATSGMSAQLFNHGISQPQTMRHTTLRIYNSVIAQATVAVVHGRGMAARRH